MAVAETARLVASLELVDKFSRPIANIERSMGRLEKSSSVLRRGLGTALGIGIDRAARAAVGLGKSVITTAISFEEAFAGVRKTVEATDEQLATLQQSFRDTAKETGIAFEELARIGQIAGALGVATDSIDEFALAVAKASTATGLTVDELSDSLGRIGTILKLDEGTYETFLSTLVELGNKGASTEAEILEITKRFAITGKQAGLTTDQILGLSSAISSLGVAPEAAGTGLSRIMANFVTDTANATDEAKEFARISGQSFKEFSKSVEDDALGAVLTFLEELNKLDKFEKFRALEEAGITNTRDRNAVLAFATNIGEVRRQLGLANDEFGKTNALSEEFRKRQETAAAQLAIVKANLRDVANTIGVAVLPKIKELSQEFLGFVNQPDTQRAIKDFAAEIPGVVDSLVGIARDIPWAAIGSAATLMGTGAKALLSAFEALPSWVQTAVLTGWGFNAISGGALTKVFGNLTGELLGRISGGLLGARGGSAFTPVYVKEVAPLGGGKVPGIPPIIPGAGLLGSLGGIPGVSAILATISGGIIALKSTSDALEKGQIDLTAALAGISGPGGLIGLATNELLKVFGLGTEHTILGGRKPGAATPLGQFTPANLGGTPMPVKIVEGGGAFNAIEVGLKHTREAVRKGLKENDIHAARIAQKQLDTLNKLRDVVGDRINDIIPHLGKVNTALSLSNRKLDQGNERQRELAQGIREARDRIGSGFQASNEQLRAIRAKDFSPNVNVRADVTTQVSINDVIRVYEHAYVVGTGAGFGPGPP